MHQLVALWRALSPRRRLVVILATAIVFAAVLLMARMAGQPRLVLLYAGLENASASKVVQALEQNGQPYEVRGSSIFVDAAARDELRILLAGQGLPENSSKGYELLDTLNGFGTTSQMFDAAYWRAKEGELARTILTVDNISSARVHIANTGANPFDRDIKPSASVSVMTSTGGISPNQAKALRHLIASAVPGLAADAVSIIHGTEGLIGGEDPVASTQAASERATALREKVQRLVEARVGPGNAVVEVSIDPVLETEVIRELRFDPEGRVVSSSEVQERSLSSEGSANSGVTVASNLPDGEANGNQSSSNQQAESKERLNFEISETRRELQRQAGGIKRLTVAVLVNGKIDTTEDAQTQFVPVPEPELEDLRELVASAVGFNPDRGDQITIKSLPFERPEGLGTPAINTGLSFAAVDWTSIIQSALTGLVALAITFFVLRPMLLNNSESQSSSQSQAALEPPDSTAELDTVLQPPLSGEIDTGSGFEPIGMLGGEGDGFAPLSGTEDPAGRLRNLLNERKEETVEILRSWLGETETSESR